MSAQASKWVRFWALFALWLVADLWSKHWADVSLAGSRHPLPVTVSSEEAGKPLGEVLKARFGWDDKEILRQLGTMQRLQPAVAWKPEDRPFLKDGPTAGTTGIWVFWRGDRDLPPRRFDFRDRGILTEWLVLAHPDVDRAKVVETAHAGAAEVTFSTWFHDVFRKLGPEDVPALFAEGRVHPIPAAEPAMSLATPVVAGETFLVLDHQVDVMGEWWKFTYAENPGAAFGFLKGLSPDVRHWIFMFLTLIAFVVIGSIVAKLPTGGWLVVMSFGSILAGAAGNFVDRIRYGFVIDFIDMDLGFMHWPTYNVADIAIAVGVIALILDLTFNKKSLLASKKPEPKAS